MTEPVTVRLNDELHAKILSEAEEKKCSASQIIRERIEQSYVIEETQELKQKLSRMESKIIEIAPQARRAENLSWWTITLLAEFMRHELGPEKFRIIEGTADEKFDVYRHTRELDL